MDSFAMLLSARTSAFLRQARGWSQKRYIETMKPLARASLVAGE